MAVFCKGRNTDIACKDSNDHHTHCRSQKIPHRFVIAHDGVEKEAVAVVLVPSKTMPFDGVW
jgi:hypothetical protein